MRLVSLEVADWRNVASAQLDTNARFVVLHGDNAQGKTNLLEAVWTLSNLRSFRESRYQRLIRHECDSVQIDGMVVGESGRRRLRWARSAASRTMQIDGQNVRQLRDWFAVLRAVLFCPEHGAIIRGGPVERRSFVDRAAFTTRPAHLDVVRQYARVLRHKAALLRSRKGGRVQVESWNSQLALLGGQLAARRAAALCDLSEPFVEAHRAIAGPRSGVATLRMRGLGRAAPGERLDPAVVTAQFIEKLSTGLDDEIRQARCLVGPHRDDLVVDLDGHPARNFASQGQARSLVLALKLAELEAARRQGLAPLFLLDDLTSELDRSRMVRLMEVLADLKNQVWLTTTDPRWLGPLPGGDVV
ncbi:MAG TPA: DNA replication and repair protein RecF, partial [Deltaproteobacteria bacterium]|nr:DNA replication and repair protein RecF [Deltaproteobacteria bacterium]